MNCSCGNDEFYALQPLVRDVVLDHNGNIKEVVGNTRLDTSVPYVRRPFSCTECGKKYLDWEDYV